MSNIFADVASYQPDTLEYFTALKNYGCKAVVIKATEGSADGTAYKNPKAPNQLKNALAVGLKPHFYHFFRGTSVQDAKNEADFFVSYVQQLTQSKNMVMVCDYETLATNDKATNTSYINAFFEQVKAHGYANVDFYCYTSMINNYVNISDIIAKNIWQADYNSSRGSIGVNVGAWQYSSSTVIGGATTDLSIDYNGFYTSDVTSSASTENTTSKTQQYETFTDDLGVTWYKETGTFTTNTAIKLRYGATTSSTVITTLSAGTKVKYDAFCHSGGYVWLRQPRSNGYGYLASGKSQNGKRVDTWGTFS